MGTKLTFDVSAVADAVEKAGRVSPTKGPAFDRSQGILMEVNTEEQICTIKATNLDVTYQQRVPFTEYEGTSVSWRVPAHLLAGAVGSLPPAGTVEFIDNDTGDLYIRQAKFVAKLKTIDTDSFPRLEVFSSDGMIPANEFANRAEQVAWACERRPETPLGGVYIDGEYLVGCDKNCLAIVPCEIPVLEPVSVPLWNIASMLRKASDVRLRAVENQLQLMLDAETRATSQLIEMSEGHGYPNYRLLRRSIEDCAVTTVVNKTQFLDSLARLTTLTKEGKQPRLRVEVDCTGMFHEIILDMDIPQVGRMRDAVDCDTEFGGKFTQIFVPSRVEQAVGMSRSDSVTISFGSNDEHSLKKPMRVSDSSGYECYLMSILESNPHG